MIRGYPSAKTCIAESLQNLSPSERTQPNTIQRSSAEHITLTNDIITVDDMKEMPAYPEGEQRRCRTTAVNKAKTGARLPPGKRGKDYMVQGQR